MIKEKTNPSLLLIKLNFLKSKGYLYLNNTMVLPSISLEIQYHWYHIIYFVLTNLLVK